MRQVDRRSVLIGASAAVAGILGGCTTGPSAPTPGPSSPNGSGPRLEGRIVVALQRRPTNEAWQALVDGYRERHPDVEVVWRRPEEGRDYAEWLRAVLAEDGPDRPDLVTGVDALESSDPTGVESNDQLIDLDRYRGRINPYTQQPWEQDLDFTTSLPSGGQQGIELVGTERVRPLWIYNTEMFDSAGVDPPATWSDLLTVCEQLQQVDPDVVPLAISYPRVLRRWLAAAYFDQYHPNWVNLVRAREGDWNYQPRLDGEYEWRPDEQALHASYTFSVQRFLAALVDGQLSYDTPAMARLAGDLAELLRSYANPDFFEDSNYRELFLQQRAAMVVSDSSMLSLLRLDLGEEGWENFDWSIFDFPTMTGAEAPSVVRPGEQPGGFRVSVVANDTHQVELATDFLMFWFSPVGYEPFVQADGADFRADGPSMLNEVEYPGAVREVVDEVDASGAVAASYGDFWLTGGGDPTIAGELEQLFGRLIDEDLGPVRYASAVQEHLEENMGAILSSFRLTRSDLEAPQRRPRML